MIQDLHTEIDRLKRRIKLCERVTLGSLGRYLCICEVRSSRMDRIAFLDSVFARSLSWFSSGNPNKKSIW